MEFLAATTVGQSVFARVRIQSVNGAADCKGCSEKGYGAHQFTDYALIQFVRHIPVGLGDTTTFSMGVFPC